MGDNNLLFICVCVYYTGTENTSSLLKPPTESKLTTGLLRPPKFKAKSEKSTLPSATTRTLRSNDQQHLLTKVIYDLQYEIVLDGAPLLRQNLLTQFAFNKLTMHIKTHVNTCTPQTEYKTYAHYHGHYISEHQRDNHKL